MQRERNRPILKTSADAMVNRLSKGRHVVAEHPLTSEAFDQDEMKGLDPYFKSGQLMKVAGYGCDVGYCDEFGQPYQKRFCIVTDMPAVANLVMNTRCNHPGIAHSRCLGGSHTKRAAEWPAGLDILVIHGNEQQLALDNESIYAVFAYPATADPEDIERRTPPRV